MTVPVEQIEDSEDPEKEDDAATEWPGTTLFSGSVTLLQLQLNREVESFLLAAARGLYDWKQPALPEDLAFVRADGEPLLGSIAHEQDAFMRLSAGELGRLEQEAPELAVLLKPDSAE